MRTSLMDFTRGSQIAETVTMMFGTAVRPMLYTAAAIVAASVAWRVWGETETGDSFPLRHRRGSSSRRRPRHR